jgi:RNA polymerase sigma factor (sigma-70 family)
MSPASLRRYRAERLLREEFRSLRVSVIATVRERLRACGAALDPSDLDACYAQAWQGLYAATLDGQHIVNPPGWLAVVTFRRAIDEHRAQSRAGLGDHARPELAELAARAEPSCEPDMAAQLDERRRLRQLLEGLRLALGERERHAATLCYLQGYSRREAARSLGVSEARMRKLMEGHGAGRPGVAGKVAALAGTIAAGEWCEEQGSLMRGLAYGVLDPDGERHQLALAHTSACPACRAYVASLRGLAALLPPVPTLLAPVLAGGGGAGAALGHAAASASGHAARAATQAGGAVPAPAAISSGAAASGAAGAAGGGWLLAGGGIGAKLAAGCLIALGVGAGCAVLGSGQGPPAAPARAHAHARSASAATRRRGASRTAAPAQLPTAASPPRSGTLASSARAWAPLPAGATPASREFGLEHAATGARGAQLAPPRSSPRRHPAARVASAGSEFSPAASQAASPAAGAPPGAGSSGAASAAQREFSPG